MSEDKYLKELPPLEAKKITKKFIRKFCHKFNISSRELEPHFLDMMDNLEIVVCKQQNSDLQTNAAIKLAAKLKLDPLLVAEEIRFYFEDMLPWLWTGGYVKWY